jgi:cyclophilin family peptidyl-prolyl cis-trans isomerase
MKSVFIVDNSEWFTVLSLYRRHAMVGWETCRVRSYLLGIYKKIYIVLTPMDSFVLSLRSFGKVVSGMDVVSAIEQVGSESGVTRVPVVIADSGQLR